MSATPPRHRRPAPPPAGSAVAGLVLGVAALVALSVGAAVDADASPGLDRACVSSAEDSTAAAGSVELVTFCAR